MEDGMKPRGLTAVGAVLSLAILIILIVLPALAHAMPAECAAEDAAISEKVRALMPRHDPNAVWLLGHSLASLKVARGLCLGHNPEQAHRIYANLETMLRGADQQLTQATVRIAE
jgi:hypothetical protein